MTHRKCIANLIKGAFILCAMVMVNSQAFAQATEPVIYQDDPEELKRQFIKPTYFPEHITKKPGHYTTTQWNDVIDSTWGMGRIKSQKLAAFNSFWNWVDQDFSCFATVPGYNANFWDSLKTLYLTEIENGDSTYGVSKGRFAAILNYLAQALRESHTYARDYLVNYYTSPGPGVPLFLTGGWGNNNHFGAGLTPLPDSTLLVYQTVASHPLGLVPGDIVLGYDGILWKDLYPQLIEEQLPFYEFYWRGGSESSYAHSMLMSAGANWHLFDTLDVIQYSTGDTLHFSTSLLDGQEMVIRCTEQMNIPGVSIPNYYAGERVTYGVIDGTQIGYIYVCGWSGGAEQDFANAINTLMTDYETTGMIIDYRFNFGGFMHLGQKGFELLFNTTEPAYEWLVRTNPNDHLVLNPNGVPNIDTYFSYIYGAANTYFDKPIAVLVGPGALSGGDFAALVMKKHPMTRFFGKPTSAAFNRPYGINMVYTNDFGGRYAEAESYMIDNPGQHLTRFEFPVDEEVWLTQEDVSHGDDTVVDAAVAWINGQASNQPDITWDVASLEITLEPGEIVTQDITIINNGTGYLFYSLTPLMDEYTQYHSANKTVDSPSAPVIAGHGGPDNYGYSWIDSDQPHGPSPDWVDISSSGTPVHLTDDSFDGPFNLGFNFPFYGNIYSEVYISSNGFLTFGSGHSGWFNRPIPFNYSPNNYIAPWWDNLNPAMGGDIYYYQDNGNRRFIVSYVDVEKDTSSATGTVTCQAILYGDGRIEFNYLDMNLAITHNKADYYTATVGIENNNGSDGLQVFYNAGYFLDNFSVKINTNWLAVSPSSGYIAPGDSVIAPITISARYLDWGTYTGNIYIDSNDPQDSSIIIPVSLTVQGSYEYLPGDANMSVGSWPPLVIGGDVTYLVNYFRGLSNACLLGGFYCAGDANGDCLVIGSDVTRMVTYFRGLAEITPCPDYEPSWPTPDDLPVEAPSGWPNCETPPVSSKIINGSSVK